MLIDELVDDLWRQVNPDVKDAILGLVLERLEQVFLDVAHDGVRAPKVQLVPLAVRLTAADALLANRSVGQQMVDELDGEHLDLVVLLEAAHIDMVSLRDVQEDTVDEEKERFNVEELAPTETEIKEELGEPLVVDTSSIQLVNLALLAHCFQLAALLQASLLFGVHKPLIFFVKLFTALVTFRLFVCLLIDLLKVTAQLVRLLPLLLLSLQVNLPVLFGRFPSGRLIEV